MVDCGAHHPLAALPLSRLEPSETIRGHQRPSEAIRDHQRPSVALGRTRSHSVAISDNQWQSVAISGTRSHSVALRGTQRHSGALRGTPRHSAATLSCLSSYETLMSSSRISRELGLISCACTSAAHASRGLPRPTCACHPMSVDNQCHGQAKASQGKPRQATARSGTHLTHPEVCLGALRGGRPRLQHLGAAAERRRERSGERTPLARLGARYVAQLEVTRS